MGKYGVHSFCKLGAFVFLLYFAKVLTVSTHYSVLDVMKKDPEVCTVPAFFYESNITKICSQLEYPAVPVSTEYSHLNNFLCLALYDTWYKVCKSNQFQSVLNITTFSSYIQKFFPEDNEVGRNKFCKNIEGLTFSYPKLKPLLSHAHLNKSHVCNIACFDLEEKFNQLCAILTWSISIDDNERKNGPLEGKLNVSEQTKPEKALALESQIDKHVLLEKGRSNINTNKDNSLNGSPKNTAQKLNALPSAENKSVLPANANSIKIKEQQPVSYAESTVLNEKKEVLTNTMTVHNILSKTSKAENSDESIKEDVNNNKNDRKTSNNNEERQNVKDGDDVIKIDATSKIKETIKDGNNDTKTSANDETKTSANDETKTSANDETKTSANDETKTNANDETKTSANDETKASANDETKTSANDETKTSTNNDVKTSANDGVEQPVKNILDIKTSTISENTQDHDNSANQDVWNRIDEDKSPYDPNEGPYQSIDSAGDQNQNIPEPSEQREIISHYHSIRSDEESHFFTYFTVVSLISIAAYIGYHNKQKILAIVLEGRRSRNSRGRRRPSTANYRKLDCTLEEAVTSQCNANVTHVIY